MRRTYCTPPRNPLISLTLRNPEFIGTDLETSLVPDSCFRMDTILLIAETRFPANGAQSGLSEGFGLLFRRRVAAVKGL